jgi:hypothetical protein
MRLYNKDLGSNELAGKDVNTEAEKSTNTLLGAIT